MSANIVFPRAPNGSQPEVKQLINILLRENTQRDREFWKPVLIGVVLGCIFGVLGIGLRKIGRLSKI